MAKINTLNYQTVASWNGSQDLFVVEQLDGTKVATPAMVKQFIEAGDFVATGEVKDGHGNTLADLNSLLLPVSKVVKRFVIDNPNRTIDTGINVNLATSIGFIALVSSYGSYNAGRMNVYIGGVPHNKQNGTCGEFKVERLGGIALGGETAVSDNVTFTVTNDTLRISSPSNQGGLRITLILTTSA